MRSVHCHSIEPRSFLIADPNCQNCLLQALIANLQQILAELGILNAAVEDAQSRSLFSRQLFPETISTTSDVVEILELVQELVNNINTLNVVIKDIEDTSAVILELKVTKKVRNYTFNTILIIIIWQKINIWAEDPANVQALISEVPSIFNQIDAIQGATDAKEQEATTELEKDNDGKKLSCFMLTC